MMAVKFKAGHMWESRAKVDIVQVSECSATVLNTSDATCSILGAFNKQTK